jgi:hypothetical protein
MADERPSTEEEAAPPRRLRDNRLVARLAACMIAFVAITAGGVLALFSGWVPQQREWQVLLACVLGGFACLGFLFAPLLLGMRCKRCGRRIFRAAAQPRGDGATPVRFYCPACHVEWESGLVTAPGEGMGDPSH